MRLFGHHRKEAEEAEARQAMKALDETVNQDAVAPKKWLITLRCHGRDMVKDPANTARWICGTCNAVLLISVERRPDPDKL